MAPTPMFPLGTVLLPGSVLPLHVFEHRYRQLTEDCLAGDGRFGVALIARGSEVGGGDQRVDVGTVARIVDARRFADGRWAVVAVGVERVRVDRWLDDDPYPRAEIEPWPDPPAGTASAPALAGVVAHLRRTLALAAELGDPAAPATTELSDEPGPGSFQAAALAPLGPMDRQSLLEAPGPDERIALLGDLLADARDLLELRLGGRSPDRDDPER